MTGMLISKKSPADITGTFIIHFSAK